MLLVEAVDIFAKDLRRRGYSSKTIEAYLFDLKKFSIHLENTRNVDEASIVLDEIDIEAIRSWIDKNLEMGISLRTISRRLSTIKSLFRFLFSENLVDDHIKLEKIKLPRVRRQPPQALAQEEIYELLDIQDTNDPNHIMYQSLMILMYSCGLRVGETASLRIRDIDLPQKSVRVMGKGAKERVIPLQNAAYRSLLKHLELREKAYPDSLTPENPLFYKETKSGLKPMNIRRIQYLLEKRGKSAGLLKHVHPHLLRHSIATHLIERGANVESVRQTLGHESLATTSIYIKSSSKFIREEHNKFNPIDSLIK